MRQTRLLRPVLACAVCLLALVGCGKKPIPIKGKVVLPANVKLAENDSVSIAFVPEDKSAKPAVATFKNADQSFTANVTPGKYKVTCSVNPYSGAPGSEKRKDYLKPLNEAYASNNTKLSTEVTSTPDQSFTIDLAKGTITK